MLTRERQAALLAGLARDGRIVAKEAARVFAVSEDTVRRDLRELAGLGKLQRVHGGALPAAPATADFAGREQIAMAEKSALAARAAERVMPGQVLFVDGGTTSVAFARALPDPLEATVVTHSPSVAVALSRHPSVTVELIGGRLFKHSVVAVGAGAAASIRGVRADIFVMGVTGLHAEFGATTGDREEAQIKALMAAQSAETMVIASAEKLGAVSPYRIVPLSEVATLVAAKQAAKGAAKAALGAMRRCGVELVLG